MRRKRAFPKYVYEDGTRLRFKRLGFHYDFRNPYGTEAFEKELSLCRKGIRPGDIERETINPKGTMNALAEYYYSSHKFKTRAPATQIDYRCVIDKFLETYGNTYVDEYDYETLTDIMSMRAHVPSQANKLLKRLKTLFMLARRLKWIKTDPCEGVERVKTPSDGYISWTEEDIQKYEATHPRGSLARRALYLMLYTGARKGDCVKFGRQNLKNGRFEWKAGKNKQDVSLLILPPLQQELDLVPQGQMQFILTEAGKPFTVNGFGNKMRRWCDQAGLKLSAHGLRKAMATRLAEAEATEDQISAVLMVSPRVAAIYTKQAAKPKLADAAIAKLRE